MSEQIEFTVGGTKILLSKQDVEQRLARVQPEAIREIYVEVNGKQYPVKQALADVTGLHRGNFTSHDAMRVFRKLGLVIGPDSATWSERFYTSLKSLNEYDKMEVRDKIAVLLRPTAREECVLANYRRAKANIESLLALRYVKDFQAITMLARNLFELAVDMRLLDSIPGATDKIALFAEVEKLKSAERIVAYRTAHPKSGTDASIQGGFVAANKTRIDASRKALWGTKPPVHWSNMNLRERAKSLGGVYEETYEVRYAQLSWYTHPAGHTGFDLKAATYEWLATSSFELAARFYMLILSAVIDEFRLVKVDPKIKDRMTYAQQMPFTDTDAQLAQLERGLLG